MPAILQQDTATNHEMFSYSMWKSTYRAHQ